MGSNAQTLVSSLKKEGYIRSGLVEQAFLSVPREMFVPEEFRRHSYEDTALPIGWGQTISAPSARASRIFTSAAGVWGFIICGACRVMSRNWTIAA